jgi:peptide-methionine (S)-S-oxide reductase
MNFINHAIISILALSVSILSCASKANQQNTSQTSNINSPMDTNKSQKDTATLAGGCFWCTEAIFQRLKGVDTVIAGYTGGTVKNPSYREVCTGTTGHAEGIQIIYDPKVISFTDLLEVFFKFHDPTTLNSQGADHGTQYRSGIFYHSEEQKKTAEKVIKELTDAKAFDDPIVTEITPYTNFYSAEDYHQNYFNNNKEQGYCRVVINPKVEKLEKVFKEKLK